METISLRIGGTPLTLQKSDTLAGIRPARGGDSDAERAVSAIQGEVLPQKLGGFQLINLRQATESLERGLDALRESPSVSVGTHVYYTSDDKVPFVPTGNLYVVFTDKAPLKDCQKLLDDQSLEVVKTDGPRKLTARVTAPSTNPVKVAAALQQSKLIAIAEPELATPGRLSAFVLPSDSLLNRQWHLRNTGTIDGSTFNLTAGADARVIAAWQKAASIGSPSVIVAVIDDGFDPSHPDLSGAGKVVAPWDFTRNSSNSSPEFSSNYPYWDNTNQEWAGDWHGTACAGVAVGSANSTGILGGAPASRLMPVRWGPDLSDSQVVAWFDYVAAQGAAVVSCSWSAAAKKFVLSTPISEAIARCATQGRQGKGCVICFAAGNENRDIYDPSINSINGFAIHDKVIAVAACTSRDARSDYSNFGKAISVCAPSSGSGGRRIVTADVGGQFTRNGVQIESGYSAGAYTDSFGGTSSATPLVAGICALLLSIDPQQTAVQIKKLIQDTARKIGPASAYDANGHSTKFGYGCIDAEAAVAKLLAPSPSAAGSRSRRVKAKTRRVAKTRK